MKNILILLFLGISQVSHSMSFEEAIKLTGSYDEPVMEYLNQRLAYENKNKLDAKGDCYSLPGDGVPIIIRIDKSGVVDEVYLKSGGEKSLCFKKTYMSTAFGTPPKAPIYVIKLMDYNGKYDHWNK